jgi:hypothetical protein
MAVGGAACTIFVFVYGNTTENILPIYVTVLRWMWLASQISMIIALGGGLIFRSRFRKSRTLVCAILVAGVALIAHWGYLVSFALVHD